MVDSFTLIAVLIEIYTYVYIMKRSVKTTNFLRGLKATIVSSYILVLNLIKKTQNLPLVPKYFLYILGKLVKLFNNFMKTYIHRDEPSL